MYSVSRLPAAFSIAVIGVLASGPARGTTGPSEQPSTSSEPARIALAHPFLFFDKSQTAELVARKDADPLLTACWEKLVDRATGEDNLERWTGQLEARALLWQLQGYMLIHLKVVMLKEKETTFISNFLDRLVMPFPLT